MHFSSHVQQVNLPVKMKLCAPAPQARTSAASTSTEIKPRLHIKCPQNRKPLSAVIFPCQEMLLKLTVKVQLDRKK